ncbi:hypothetical protein CTEN210_03483 [Chaetoceros tenuissimus]|uniref:Uncharacterized protein n=1 Tax=Chaetoceros tenuissimus TaxID=426638 RepID=A0AAD3CK06_9STRA|nr:hypothetical protein CTEN210_03483 [Chaetoceros tenuissimus]
MKFHRQSLLFLHFVGYLEQGEGWVCQTSLQRTTKSLPFPLRKHFFPTTIKASNDANDDQSINELYKTAMEEDEEWYNEFVRDVLGEDNLPSFDEPKTTSVEPKWRVASEPENETKLESTDNGVSISSEDKLEGDDEEKQSVVKDVAIDNELPNDIAHEEATIEEFDSDEDETDKEDLDSRSSTSIESEESEVDDEDSSLENNQIGEDVLVEYIDMFDNTQRVPMATLSSLGYKMEDVARLQAGVLELIIEDEMQVPKEGIPRRWMIESRSEREVKILKRRKAPQIESNDDDDDGDYERGTSRNDRNLRRGEDARRSSSRRSDRKGRRTSKNRGTKRRPERRDEGDDQFGETDTIWMDIPTFKQYLRREADLRLSILGPDWEDWVRGESDWRLNLYKKWLGVVENGFGDDLMEEISYAPESERLPRSPKRRKTSRDLDSPRERRTKSRSGNIESGRRRPPLSRERAVRRSDDDDQIGSQFRNVKKSSRNSRRVKRAQTSAADMDDTDYQETVQKGILKEQEEFSDDTSFEEESDFAFEEDESRAYSRSQRKGFDYYDNEESEMVDSQSQRRKKVPRDRARPSQSRQMSSRPQYEDGYRKQKKRRRMRYDDEEYF